MQSDPLAVLIDENWVEGGPEKKKKAQLRTEIHLPLFLFPANIVQSGIHQKSGSQPFT